MTANLLHCELIGEQGWLSGESARLPPMWPGFKPWTQCHMWVEFVVGSCPCSEGFSLGYPVFLSPQTSTFLNSNLIGNSRAIPSLNKVNLLFFFTDHS